MQAWARFAARYPGETARMRERVWPWGTVVRDRETARSENMRAFWVLRAYVVRAGELSGAGDDVFFLHRDELLDLLRGDKAVLDEVPVRRATYEQYAALPPYPALIRSATSTPCAGPRTRTAGPTSTTPAARRCRRATRWRASPAHPASWRASRA